MPWIGSLLHMALNGRKKFTPNEIGEFHFGEGSELTDRTGLRFRTKYRDVLETILTFGGGDLLAVDNHQNVIKRWDNIIGLFFFWKDLDRVLHQRAAVMDIGRARRRQVADDPSVSRTRADRFSPCPKLAALVRSIPRTLGRWCCAWSASTISARWPICRRSPSRRRAPGRRWPPAASCWSRFCLALPVYWYVVGRSPDGRGATGMLEDLIPGWRGKLVVLTLLGFAAADFVITRSLSLADAAIHLIHNPHGQRLLGALPAGLFERRPRPVAAAGVPAAATRRTAGGHHARPVDHLVRLLANAQARRHAADSARHGGGRVVLPGAVGAGDRQRAGLYVAQHPEIWQAWLDTVFATRQPVGDAAAPSNHAWLWAWLRIALWSFPQMALGLSGFEMIMTVVPRVSGGAGQEAGTPAGRVRNTRKLMVTAASIMAVYLVSAVVGHHACSCRTPSCCPAARPSTGRWPTWPTARRLADGASGAAVNPLFGDRFGDLFDLSSAFILCLAGASVTMGLQNLLPHYLNRLGMEVSWAGKVGVIMHRAQRDHPVGHGRVSGQPVARNNGPTPPACWCCSPGRRSPRPKTCGATRNRGPKRIVLIVLAAGAGGFFLAMTGLTVLINHSGLTIALAFVLAILVSSFVSRWIRSTELRFEGFEFADEAIATAVERAVPLRRQGARAAPPGPDFAGREMPESAARLSPRPGHARHLHRSHARRPEQLLPKAAHEDRARRGAGSDPRLALRERLARARGDLPGTVPRRRRARPKSSSAGRTNRRWPPT